MIAAMLLSLALPGITTAPNVTIEPIASLSSTQHVWRIHDKAHRMVCYLIMPERGLEVSPALNCLPSFYVGEVPGDPSTRLRP